jgi:hypothetical protein
MLNRATIDDGHKNIRFFEPATLADEPSLSERFAAVLCFQRQQLFALQTGKKLVVAMAGAASPSQTRRNRTDRTSAGAEREKMQRNWQRRRRVNAKQRTPSSNKHKKHRR